MRKSSWIIVGVIVALLGFLGFTYLGSRSAAPETLTQAKATEWLDKMKTAAEKKDIGTLMTAIAPQSDTRIADVNPDQFRLLLARAFRSTGQLKVTTSNVAFGGGDNNEAELSFDLLIQNATSELLSDNYKGRITVRLKRVEVSRALGLLQSKEWRVVGATSTGPSLGSFGD